MNLYFDITNNSIEGQSANIQTITKVIFVPTPGVPGVLGVPGEPGELGGIEELGDRGT